MRPKRVTLDAIFALIRRALGHALSAHDLKVISEASPADIVRLGSAHAIVNLLGRVGDDPELAAVLDPDLILFLREMRDRNRERNAVLRAQLLEAGTLLENRGIPSVALKGGAELIAPLYADPADRFLSDIDILVPAEALEQAMVVLQAHGYTTHGAPYPEGDIHAPALWHEAWPTAIELHTAVCERPWDRVLGARDVLERAVRTSAFPIAVPTQTDRLAHLVLHAQVHSGRFASDWLFLRDMADLFVLTRNPYNLETVQTRFAGAELTPLLESFLAAGEMILNEPFRGKDQSGSVQADAWAFRTLAHLRRPPALLRGRLLRHWLRYYGARFFGNATLRRKYLDDLRNPEAVRRFLERHRDSLRGFQ